MSVRRRAGGALAVGVAVALTAGCLPTPTKVPAGSRSVAIEATADPTSFDPAKGRQSDDYMLADMLYDTVLARDGQGRLIGGLASTWKVESASRYIFDIRKDAECADGTPITPSAVAASLNYLGGNTGVRHAFGALVFGKGAPRITGDDAAGTVVVETATPYAEVPSALTVPQSGIICPAGLADLPGLARGTVKGAFSGPYALTSARPGVGYTLTRRDDYAQWSDFARALPGTPPQRFEVGFRTDISTSANRLLTGDLGMAAVTGETLGRFSRGGYRKVPVVSSNVYVMFNDRPGRYFADNQPARRAVGQAIDRKAFSEVFSAGTAPIINSVVTPDYRCALDDAALVPTQSSKDAAQVLKGAKIKFVASNGFLDSARGAEYIFQVLTEAGAEVTLEKVDNATWATKTQSPGGDWDMSIMGDNNSARVVSASLDRVLGPALESGGRNIPGNRSDEATAELTSALASSDPAAQCGHYERAQRLLLERNHVFPLTTVSLMAVSPPDVVVQAPVGLLSYRNTRIVEDAS